MALKEQLSRSNLGSVSFSSGDYTSGACNLFGEMLESEWRSPSRVLEVTIHRAYYPITEKVLHLVFDPFGEVEHVHVLGGSDHLLAQVVFETKHAAAEAFGELHGRCVYTGCCQLDIKWRLSQDSGATMEKGHPNTIASMTPESNVSGITSESDTMANASPVRSASAITAMSTLNGNINSVMLPMEATATETHNTCAIAASYDSDDVAVQPVTVVDTMGHGIAEEHQVSVASTQVQAPVASAITEEVIIDTTVVAAAALPIDMAANKVFEEEMLSGSLFNNGIGLEMLVKPPCHCKYLLSACNFNTCELRRACVPLDVHLENTVVLWLLLSKLVEQQPWPPPAELEVVCGDAKLRPLPWPSFNLAEEVNIGWCFSLLGKTLWPPPACRNFSCVLAEMEKSREHMLVTVLRSVAIAAPTVVSMSYVVLFMSRFSEGMRLWLELLATSLFAVPQGPGRFTCRMQQPSGEEDLCPNICEAVLIWEVLFPMVCCKTLIIMQVKYGFGKVLRVFFLLLVVTRISIRNNENQSWPLLRFVQQKLVAQSNEMKQSFQTLTVAWSPWECYRNHGVQRQLFFELLRNHTAQTFIFAEIQSLSVNIMILPLHWLHISAKLVSTSLFGLVVIPGSAKLFMSIGLLPETSTSTDIHPAFLRSELIQESRQLKYGDIMHDSFTPLTRIKRVQLSITSVAFLDVIAPRSNSNVQKWFYLLEVSTLHGWSFLVVLHDAGVLRLSNLLLASKIRVIWDPGGLDILLHRLEGKPKLKGEEMLGAIVLGCLWAVGRGPCPVQPAVQKGNTSTHEGDR